MKKETTIITLEMPNELITRIEAELEQLGGLSRSAFIRQAIMEKLAKSVV